jgi:TetR/AcrR family transcriptional regulator, transcriptional repressor for nem operon
MDPSTLATNDTKERILDAAETIMLEKGFNGVGINEILKSVGVPKGSFYHWFASKEQFGVELLNHYGTDAISHKRLWLLNQQTVPNALDRFIAYMEKMMTCFIEKDCHQVCLIVKLSAEVSSWSDAMRHALEKFYAQGLALYQAVIEEGQAQGSIRKDLDARHAAAVIHDAWLGCYIRATVDRSVEPGRDVINFVKSYLSS